MVELDRAQARRFAHISKAALSWTHHCERKRLTDDIQHQPAPRAGRLLLRRYALATTALGWCAERNGKP